MCRVEVTLKYLLIGTLMWATILQPFGEPTWILEFQHSYAESKKLSAYNTMGLTKQDTTANSHNVVKQMKKQILLNWKQSKMSYALTLSSALIAEKTIKQTLTSTCSGDTNSTANGIAKNSRNCVISGINQFTQLWVVYYNDLQQP